MTYAEAKAKFEELSTAVELARQQLAAADAAETSAYIRYNRAMLRNDSMEAQYERQWNEAVETAAAADEEYAQARKALKAFVYSPEEEAAEFERDLRASDGRY